MMPVTRRQCLSLFGAASAGSAPVLAAARDRAATKQFRGVFPILQTPFTDSDKISYDILAKELRFLDKGGVHGGVWPQLASEYGLLSKEERFTGAEAILSAAKGLRITTVIGVQAADIADVTAYAKHAEKNGADAIIALPPADQRDLEYVREYYRAIGKATQLPLFIQAVGKMDVDFIVSLAKEVPSLKFDKDEAGAILTRMTEFRKKAPQIGMFSGNHGQTMLDEMHRGSAGTMPAAPFADLYAQVWDLWQAGKKKQATEMFGRTLLLCIEVMNYGLDAVKYVLELRGVFVTHHVRRRPLPKGAVVPGPGSGVDQRTVLDQEGMEYFQELVKLMKPYFKA